MDSLQTDQFDPDLGVVVVLETNDRLQLGLARGLLDEAGISYNILGQITTLVNDVDPFLKKWVRLQVSRDQESEALEVLEPVLHPEPISPGEEN